MANPVGEDSWHAYVEEERRHALDLEGRVKVVEDFKKAIVSEPGSLKLWVAYCEYFWSLFTDSQSNEAGWPQDEQQLGREIFSFDSALSLWSEGYEAIKFRLNDSHEFWNRWVLIEQEQLARTRTPVGVQRITQLFRDRLQIPHATWDNTSQMFSSFLSTYNNAAYESEFQQITATAQVAKEAYSEREPFELRLSKAARSGDEEAQKAVLKEYLDWEMVQTIKKKSKNPVLAATLSLALYSRAVTGIFSFDDDIWSNYAVYLSSVNDAAQTSQIQGVLPDTLGVLQRATSHCPWSGMLWSRYILSAEEAGSAFHDMEHIKHAATNAKALDKNGMAGVIDMYAAWCGYLKRTALDPNASEDAVDIADVGLVAALEDVQLWGERLYQDEYRGDPSYRLERILILYLTEKKGDVEDARGLWNRMSEKPLLANSYDFWLNYYLWEMMIFSAHPRQRSPTPATPANGAKAARVPSMATNVLTRALRQSNMDWPERVLEIYRQHCNDYEQPPTLRRALDTIHKTTRRVEKRRARERAAVESTYAAQAQAQQQAAVETAEASAQDLPLGPKRKREETPEDLAHLVNKRLRNAEASGSETAVNEQSLKRDRENASIVVRNLPPDVGQKALRKYFKDYGLIKHVDFKVGQDGTSAAALVEFESPEEVKSALLKDNKYFGGSQISVKPGTGLTLFVTNYPPTADEEYLTNLFKDCGEIFAIRLPSLSKDARRRFCYIAFDDPGSAAKATRLDGKLIDGKYQLVAKYSEPAKKKDREGAVAEGRELHIKNIDLKTTEDDLRSMFEKYGKVQSINIPKKIDGRNKGHAFAVMQTKDQAELSLELNKTKLSRNIIDVELSKEKKYKPSLTTKGGSESAATSPAPSVDADVAMAEGADTTAPGRGPSRDEIQARTMAILDLPDTVNDARVRVIAEKHGDIVKLVSRPDHQGAIIEYKDVASAGRAMAAINGFEIAPGKTLQTGTVDDLFKKGGKQSFNKDNRGGIMPPPQFVRRPNAAKPKQRMGFTATKKPEIKEETNGTSSKPKSNADFKAMFLGGK
ncbi:putative pre-mRNA splicing factor [Xylariales sp. AK1849]|nr:putative pre-mRNA splicing factor [Xylariales sp. AK1849]